jgi:hypothetical protein
VTEDAQLGTPVGGLALAARHLEAGHDAVALGHARHLLTDGLHATDELVPDRDARLDAAGVAVVDVQVRPAHAGQLGVHDRVRGLVESGFVDLANLDLAGALIGDGSHRSVGTCRAARTISRAARV